MRTFFALILFLWTSNWAITADKINIPQPVHTIKTLKDAVKKQTGYTLVIPFADDKAKPGKLPARMSQKDLLDWICRYYEEQNGIRLVYEYRNRSIFFKNIDRVDSTEREKILSKKIYLLGKNLNIQEAIKQASEKSNIEINLPLQDKAALRSDYNYRCTLGEFLSEVKHYYRSYNRTFVTFGVEKKQIRFYQQGHVSSRRLDVGILPKQIQNTPVKIEYPDVKPIRKNKIKKLEIKSSAAQVDDFDKRVQWLKTFSLHDFFIEHKMNRLLVFLTAPRKRDGEFSSFYRDIQAYLRNLKGYREFKEKLLSLDDFRRSDFEKNRIMEELEELWVRQLLKRMLNQKQDQPHPGKFIFSARGAYKFGNGASKIGNSPIHRIPQDGNASWFELGASVEYHSKIQDLWIYQLKGHADFSMGSNDAGESLEYGSLAAEYEANRQVAYLNLMSISPYVSWIREDDIGSQSSIQAHDLFMSGLKLHWYEKNKILGFQQGITDSEILVGFQKPLHNQKNSIVSNEKRDSFVLGFIQHFALMNSKGKGYTGPTFHLGYIERSSDSSFEDGGELLFATGYLYVREQWSSKTEAEVSNWSRDQKVDRVNLSQEFSYSPWFKGEKFKLLLEYETSSSNDRLMDYTSKRLGLGFEKTW